MIYFISKPFKIASHPRVVPLQGCANESRCVIVCFCTPSAFWLRCSTWLRGSSPATRFFSTPPSLSTPGNSTGRQKALSDCLNSFPFLTKPCNISSFLCSNQYNAFDSFIVSCKSLVLLSFPFTSTNYISHVLHFFTTPHSPSLSSVNLQRRWR